MYDTEVKKGQVAENPKHLDEATQMADVISNFPPNQQNEMVKHIHILVKNRRENQLNAMKKELEYLTQMMNEL